MSSRKRYAKTKNNQTPSKRVKKLHNRKWKSNFKKQLHRWMKDDNFEIIEQSRNRSAYWDWNWDLV